MWRVSGGTLKVPDSDLYCGESATTLRFMTAICSLIPGKSRLVGGPSLSKRPVRSLVEALGKLGVNCSIEGKTTPPVTVEGGTLKGGPTELPGNISSQFISALLLIAPFAQKEVSIRLTTKLTSRPYLLMTIRCMKSFGVNVRAELDKFIVARQSYQPTRLEIEGDWSSASYFLALGAVSEGIEVENLSTASVQGDRVVLDLLRNMGARVRTAGNSVMVSKNSLKAVRADLSDCIDLLPTMSARENVEIPMVGHAGPKERKERAAHLLELVGLGDRMKHLPNQLSGGQRQRVAVARALANNPPLVLADEPTGNLDTTAGRELIDLLHELNQSQGSTFIVVTHDLAVARQTSRVLVQQISYVSPESASASPADVSADPEAAVVSVKALFVGSGGRTTLRRIDWHVVKVETQWKLHDAVASDA